MVHKLIKVLAKVVEVMISKEKRNGRSTHIGLVPGALRVAKIVRVTARVLDQPAVHLLLFLLLFILMLLLLLWIYLCRLHSSPQARFSAAPSSASSRCWLATHLALLLYCWYTLDKYKVLSEYKLNNDSMRFFMKCLYLYSAGWPPILNIVNKLQNKTPVPWKEKNLDHPW